MANLSKEEIIEGISNLSVLELSELVKALEEKFGIKAATVIPTSVAASTEMSQGASGGAPVAEQTEFKLSLQVLVIRKSRLSRKFGQFLTWV